MKVPSRLSFWVLLLGLAALAVPAAAQTYTGRATVVDADTIDIGEVRIRFEGIDAPESGQRCWDAAGAEYRCGQAAALALDDWLALSRPVTCLELYRDRYDRAVATCTRADGADLASWLVSAGWALDYPEYSGGAYAELQAAAAAAGLGIWQGLFVPPWDWRRGLRTP